MISNRLPVRKLSCTEITYPPVIPFHVVSPDRLPTAVAAILDVSYHTRSYVTPNLDDVMLSYLAAQTDTECFPAVLPNVMIAHKTEELSGLYDDGGSTGKRTLSLKC